jgi:hypothetical protein
VQTTFGIFKMAAVAMSDKLLAEERKKEEE